jgi:hypothetical protein
MVQVRGICNQLDIVKIVSSTPRHLPHEELSALMEA